MENPQEKSIKMDIAIEPKSLEYSLKRKVSPGHKYHIYVNMLKNSEFDGWSIGKIAGYLKVSERTISGWKRKYVPWKVLKEQRRLKYDELLLRVDAAVFNKAMKGDIRAAELVFQRFDGWVPATQQTQIHGIDEKDVDEELTKLMDRKRSFGETLKQTNADHADGNMDAAGRIQIEDISQPEAISAQK